MNIGFDTIGNATVIAYDGAPVLATDPWIQGSAYFGSWKLSHEVPPEQREAILGAPYVWISHGHPDHLNGDSLPLFKEKTILIPNHFGNRILDDLKKQGFKVSVLADRQWLRLSPHVRVMCIPDYNQDAVLLLDINGRLVFDKNDANDRGWGRFARNVIRQFPISFHLALFGNGDADMLNFFREDGRPLVLTDTAARSNLGARVSREVDQYGTRYFIPFSSMHRFQRSDSVWASVYSAKLESYRQGWNAAHAELLPAFVRYDCEKDELTEIRPPPTSNEVLTPEAFGDDWSAPLEPAEVEEVAQYFKRVEKLEDGIRFIDVRVGGKTTRVEFANSDVARGLTLECPRQSLLASVRYEIFDDLLIGNFAKVTLHGDWGPRLLYPDVTPYIAKYADNGRARTRNEVSTYLRHYRDRDPLGYIQHLIEYRVVEATRHNASRLLRRTIGANSRTFQVAKSAFWALRRGL